MKLKLPDPKRIVIAYLLVGSFWLLLKFEIFHFSSSGFQLFLWEALDSFLFIIITAILLYFLLANYENRLNQSFEKWRQSETQFRNLYEESPQPSWISSEQGQVLFMNKAAIELFGFLPDQAPDILPEELISKPNGDSRNGDSRTSNGQVNREQSDNTFKNGESGRLGIRKFVSQEGELLYLDLLIHSIRYQEKQARLVITNNVTRLIKAEREKQRINNELYHYKKALDRSALLSVTDLKGILLDVNQKFCEISKFSADELIGKNHNIVNSGYHPAVFFQRLYSTARQGKVWRGEICNRAKNGNLFWVDISVVPVMNEDNVPERFMAIAYPITDRKAAEIKSEKVQQELMTFMYKASHNLRGPVATMSGLLSVARNEVKEESSLNYIDLLNERIKHLEFTLGELIDITKIKQEELVIDKISFQSLLSEVLDEFTDEIEEYRIKVETQVECPPEFRCDPKLVKSLFYYLIDNSIKFRNNEQPFISIIVRNQPDGDVLISISDNGPGIDESIRSRIYEMYFRGSDKSTGSGLGLYIVSSIIDRLGGYIHLQSKPGKGATFTILLPDSLAMEKHRSTKSHTYLPDRNIRMNQN